MNRSHLGITILAIASAALLSGCPKKHKAEKATAPKDIRYLKEFPENGTWFCELSFQYPDRNEKGAEVEQKKTLSVVAESGTEATEKLSNQCRELTSIATEACEKRLADSIGYPCIHSSLFLPKSPEWAEREGHWACEMDYSYLVEKKIEPARKKASTPVANNGAKHFLAEILNFGAADSVETDVQDLEDPSSTLETDAPAPTSDPTPSPTPSPTVSPNPSPTPSPSPTTVWVKVSEKLSSENTASHTTVAKAFEKCSAIAEEKARNACADEMIALKMKCWNKDLGKTFRPKVKVRRK